MVGPCGWSRGWTLHLAFCPVDPTMWALVLDRVWGLDYDQERVLGWVQVLDQVLWFRRSGPGAGPGCVQPGGVGLTVGPGVDTGLDWVWIGDEGGEERGVVLGLDLLLVRDVGLMWVLE